METALFRMSPYMHFSRLKIKYSLNISQYTYKVQCMLVFKCLVSKSDMSYFCTDRSKLR